MAPVPQELLRKSLRDRWTALDRLGFQPALREGAQQVEQDDVDPVPGIQQSVEQMLVWCMQAVIVAQKLRGASDLQLSRSGRSEKGVGIAGGRLGELFHRDVAGARVDPQLGAGDAALEPVRIRHRNPSI